MEVCLFIANFKKPFLATTLWRFKHFKKYVQLKTRFASYFIYHLLAVSVGDIFQQNQSTTIIVTYVNEIIAVNYTLSPANSCWADRDHNRMNVINNCSRNKGEQRVQEEEKHLVCDACKGHTADTQWFNNSTRLKGLFLPDSALIRKANFKIVSLAKPFLNIDS